MKANPTHRSHSASPAARTLSTFAVAGLIAIAMGASGCAGGTKGDPDNRGDFLVTGISTGSGSVYPYRIRTTDSFGNPTSTVVNIESADTLKQFVNEFFIGLRIRIRNKRVSFCDSRRQTCQVKKCSASQCITISLCGRSQTVKNHLPQNKIIDAVLRPISVFPTNFGQLRTLRSYVRPVSRILGSLLNPATQNINLTSIKPSTMVSGRHPNIFIFTQNPCD